MIKRTLAAICALPMALDGVALAVGIYSWVRVVAAWQKRKERKRRMAEREEKIAAARALEARTRGIKWPKQ